RATALVDPEAVVLDPQALPSEELDQVLVLAPDTADPARKRAREAVAPDRQVGAEATVDEVASVAVVEPVVLDRDPVRPAPKEQAVRPRRRAVAAMGERAPADRHVGRVRHHDRR